MHIHGGVQIQDDGTVVELDEVARAALPSFELFFDEQHGRLYRAMFFVTGSATEAEDVVQDAFVKLWERWDRIDTIDDPVAYLFRTAMNGFRMRLRRAKVAARHLRPVSEGSDPFEAIELRADLKALLADLPPRQRAALVLTDIFDYDSAQAGDILGVRPSTVRVLVHRGRETLRAAQGGTDG
jgi:RNA polymerase sigma factor (sigma-70 family)